MFVHVSELNYSCILPSALAFHPIAIWSEVPNSFSVLLTFCHTPAWEYGTYEDRTSSLGLFGVVILFHGLGKHQTLRWNLCFISCMLSYQLGRKKFSKRNWRYEGKRNWKYFPLFYSAIISTAGESLSLFEAQIEATCVYSHQGAAKSLKVETRTVFP